MAVERLFEYIRDLPDTVDDLRELKQSLNETRAYQELGCSLQHQLRNRLLIPGAHTKDILKMYVRTHKTLQFLLRAEMRHWGVVSEMSALVVQYLLRRKDAVKCVVAALLGDDDVLEESAFPCFEDDAISDLVITVDEDERLAWIPPPFRHRSAESGNEEEEERNVVQLLVGVFGGRDRFLAEFRRMLSARLLQIGNSYECEREVASLEMMKVKFGEDDLIDCQVMLKDISNSRRLNSAIHQQAGSSLANLSALIISRHYWPNAQSSAATGQRSFLPASLESLLDEYAKAFRTMRPSQRLEWRRDQGLVDMSVEFADGLVSDFRVTPVQAAVLSVFEEEISGCSVEELAKRLHVSSEATKRELQFWVNQGILAEVDVNRYALVKQ
jgi:anaphase-promoting complex subunit 2